VTLLEEGLLAMRGCWRLLWRDPAAFEDFNVTIEGFWRSFAMIVPVLVLVYPVFISSHQNASEAALAAGENPAELRLGASYVCLLSNIVIWPLVAAALVRLLGVAQNYVRFMIVYNWMSVPMMVLALIPALLRVRPESGLLSVVLGGAVFVFFLYVSWYVAKASLQTTTLTAVVFLVADFALTEGLGALIR
jgi:hypothetical protein